eukprot:763563-Hanusia_phi.AAC.3
MRHGDACKSFSGRTREERERRTGGVEQRREWREGRIEQQSRRGKRSKDYGLFVQPTIPNNF